MIIWLSQFNCNCTCLLELSLAIIIQSFQRSEPEEPADLSSFSFYTQLVFHCFDQVGSPQEMLDIYQDINRIYYMIMMAVDGDYRGRGIAGNLITKSMEIAKLAGCEGAYVTATSGITRKIFDKRGMQEVKSQEWDKIEFKGELPCLGKDFGSDKISSHFIRL